MRDVTCSLIWIMSQTGMRSAVPSPVLPRTVASQGGIHQGTVSAVARLGALTLDLASSVDVAGPET